MSKYILLTGGLGYIGTHLAYCLIDEGYKPIIVDNLSNSYAESLDNLNILCNKKIIFKELDITDYSMLEQVASNYKIESIIHLAARKSISESIKNPSLYKYNNVIGTRNILKLMSEFSINHIVFSSSACVYDPSNNCPLNENAKINCTHPYGRSKIESEDLIKNFCNQNNKYKFSILRYFNPVGAHESSLIGEDPRDKQGNLFPSILDVIFKRKENLIIFGNDYNTHDGTPIRDYIHIMDLVSGHLNSLEFLRQKKKSHILNLGTGRGYTVLEVVKSFENIIGGIIPLKFNERRQGDVEMSFANCANASKLIGWKAKMSLEIMCSSSLSWKKNNPNGYRKLS